MRQMKAGMAAACRSVFAVVGAVGVSVEVAIAEAILSNSKCHSGRIGFMTQVQVQLQLSILQVCCGQFPNEGLIPHDADAGYWNFLGGYLGKSQPLHIAMALNPWVVVRRSLARAV
jgi:hypothetical protein